jgi:hypothetical protein
MNGLDSGRYGYLSFFFSLLHLSSCLESLMEGQTPVKTHENKSGEN